MIKTIVHLAFCGLFFTTVYADETSNYSRYQQEELLSTLDYHSTTAVSYEPIYEGYDFKSIGAPDISYYAMPSFFPVNNQGVEKQCRILDQLGSACFQKQQVLREGVIGQIKYLQRYPAYARFAQQGVDVGGQQLMATAKGLLAWLGLSQSLTEQFELVQLSNKVKFTGYYTPEIIASRVYTPRFRFPIYKKPSAQQLKLSRDEVAKGALNGQGLEIAWVDDPIALFYIHMQGSGVLRFSEGGRKVLKFSASNPYRFKSIASYMHKQGYLNGDLSRRAITHWLGENPSKLNEVLAANPRYIYFNLSDSMPSSASGLPLIAGHTVAVDTQFIPFGSVLLAEIPQFDGEGKAVGYEWRMLLPQDRGNAIVGQDRLDLYTGVGELAKRQANLITGARRTFLLLKKSAPYVKIFKSLQAGMQKT